MGTNFYAKRIPTQEQLNDIANFVVNGKLGSAQEIINEANKEIHICKRSGGWQIGFDHNWGEYYQPNAKSLIEFLDRPDIQIIDEYGVEYTFNEFWSMVLEWNADPSNYLTSKSYMEEYCEYYLCAGDIRRVKEVFNIDTDYNDFEVDGLRFSVYTNFC